MKSHDHTQQNTVFNLKFKTLIFSVCILSFVCLIFIVIGQITIIRHNASTVKTQGEVLYREYDQKIKSQVQNIVSLIDSHDKTGRTGRHTACRTQTPHYRNNPQYPLRKRRVFLDRHAQGHKSAFTLRPPHRGDK